MSHSPYLDKPLRSIAEVMAEQARLQPVKFAPSEGPVLFRWNVSGWCGEEWDTVNAWARTADQAEAIACLHHRLGKPETDPVPDAIKLADGTVHALDRTDALRMVLQIALQAERAPVSNAAE